MTNKFHDLVDRCLNAKEPNRQLDVDIALATGWIQNCDPKWGVGAPHWSRNGLTQGELIGYWHSETRSSLPYFTASMDAAKLISLGLSTPIHWLIVVKNDDGHASASLHNADYQYSADGWTDVLAICVVSLLALGEGLD